jgi:hypothetical protein
LISLWLQPTFTVRLPFVFRNRSKDTSFLQPTGDRDSQDAVSIRLELALMVALFHSTQNLSTVADLVQDFVQTTDKLQIETAQLVKDLE